VWRSNVVLPPWLSGVLKTESSYVDRRCIRHSWIIEDGIKAEYFHWSRLCKGPDMSEVVAKGEIRRHQLQRIESPVFAKREIQKALNEPSNIRGLPELIRECGISLEDCQLDYHRRRIGEKINRGDWFFIADRPIKPLTSVELEKYYGFRFSAPPCRQLSMARANMCLPHGPGRWVTRDIQTDIATNALSFAANWLTSRGDEGRVFLAEGKDYANTFRTMIQEWQPLTDGERHLKDKSVHREFGELRHIRQQFVEADDHWQLSGSSWHWPPVTADIEYELKEN